MKVLPESAKVITSAGFWILLVTCSSLAGVNTAASSNGSEPLPQPSAQSSASLPTTSSSSTSSSSSSSSSQSWAPNQDCKFYTVGENRRFERVAENLPVGQELFRVEVHPRVEFKLEAVDNSLSDINYFNFEELDSKRVAVKLAHSLEDLVDRRDPQSVLKFKLTCRGGSGTEEVFLPVTVYVQDVNDHAPEFQNVPYHLEVDELTPVGVTVFRGIQAIDRDKPNTANSDITYSIVGGNENNSFILSDPIEGILVVNKQLDYDNGIREFKIQIQASDHGSPASLSSVTTMTIRIKDADDQNPVFTQDVYRASVSETAAITGHRIREKVVTQPPIHAFDLDTGINARLRYAIILGNEGGFFEMHDQTGDLFLVREIDLESLPAAVLTLQIQATQLDNPLRQASARVDVFVVDVNDNRPEFEYDMYNITVMENLPQGFTVLQVYTFDADKGENAEFRYVLEDPSAAFRIDEKTGWISVRDPTKLDRETQARIQMKVTAQEKRPHANSSTSFTTVEINLLDANDNNPQFFPSSLYTFNVLETAPPETIVGSVFAHDNDLEENGQVIYYKQNDSISLAAPFDVHLHNGSVYVLDSFVHIPKKNTQYTFFVVASDLAKIHFERRTGTAVVRINVTDINNSVPEFIGAPYEAFVGESLPEGAFVTQISARDDDTINEVLEYSIIAGNDEKLFFMDSRSGKIFTASVLDYEKKQSYDLLVQVSDGINTAVAPLLVNVVDINDQVPIFAHSFYNFTVVEELDANTTVGTVLAIDRDSGKNGKVRYTIVGDKANEALYIETSSGVIRTKRRLDRELETMIDFSVIAFDGGTPQLSGSTNVRVRIEDINDNPPRFSQDVYAVEVAEELPAPVDVFQVVAHDADAADNAVIKYLILAGNEDNAFSINPDTGLLTTADKLNYESKSEYLLHIAARNLRPFQGPNASSIVNPAVQIMINVRDVNDELVIFDQQSYHLQIFENTPKNQVIAVLNATNPQRGLSEQDITYWVEASAAAATKFFIDPSTGELVLKETVDRDPPANEQSFKLRVFARDRMSINSFNTSVPVVIEIVDVNDNPPTFDKASYVLELPESLPFGTTLPTFYKVTDIDAGANGKIVGYYLNATEQVLSTFKINNVTGGVTLVSPMDYETRRSYDFQVIAVDGGSPPNTNRANVHIKVQDENDCTPTFLNETFIMNVTEGPTSIGTRIRLPVFDNDDGVNRQMEVYIIDGNENGEFRLDVDEGGPLLTIVSELDREKYHVQDTALHLVYVAAKDKGSPPRIGRTKVAVAIQDINDTPPKFEKDSYYEFVSENVPVGTTIITLTATDADSPSNTDLTYSFARTTGRDPFSIDPKTGAVNVTRHLDTSESEQYDLVVEAFDGAWKTTTNLKIYVREAEARDPRFDQLHYRFAVPENKAGILVGRVELKPRKFRVNSQMIYSIINTEMRSVFNITADGELFTRQGLDREQRAQYVFTVMLEEKRTSSKITVSEIIVDVLDVNDTPPKFEKDSYSEFVSENVPVGTIIAELRATDADSPANTDLVYLFGRNSDKAPFAIDPKTGIVNVTRPLDISESEHYALTVEAFDGLWKATTILKVFLSEAEERDPRFDQFHYRFAVPENQAGVLVGRVELKPRKLRVNALMRYSIVNTEMRSLFNITSEGEIYTRRGLDREKKSQFVFTVMLEEKRPSTKVTVSEVIVDVLDVNDEVPTFATSFRGIIKENSPAGTPVQVGPPAVHATDSDAGNNSLIHYSLAGEGSEMFTILDSGTVLYTPVDSSHVLDREQKAKYLLHVSATDAGNLSSSTTLTIDIEDENDNAPVFQHGPLFVLLPEIARPGSRVVQVKAVDADEPGPNSKVQYYITNGGRGELKMDKNTGEVFVVGSLRPGSIYYLNISAVDRAGLSARTTINVTVVDVNDHKPVFDHRTYNFEVPEGNYTGDHVKLGSIHAKDEDIGRNGQVEYSILNNVGVEFPFAIDKQTGELFARGFIDRESKENYNFEVTATDLGEPVQNTSCEVHIRIKDVNDVRPRFYTDPYLAHVPENLDPGHKVTQIAAFDPDLGENGQVFYRLGEGHDNKFYIDGKDGTVWTLGKLDFEEKNFYNISIIAYDRGTPSLSSVAKLWVTVADTNDAVPDFSKAVYTLEVAENAKPGDTVFTLNAGDGSFKYSLLNAAQVDTFSVEASNGRVKLSKPLDSANRNHYKLLVKAEDDSEPPKSDVAEVNIIVGTGQGVRLFPSRFSEVTVSENQLAPLLLIDLNSTDEISHRTPHYVIVGNDYSGLFKIESETGRLMVMRSLDREARDIYHLKIKAESYDSRRLGKRDLRSRKSHSISESEGSHLAFDETLVIVHVADENDNTPIFENRGKPIVAAVPLEASFGYQVTKVTAKDADTGINGAIRYEILARGDDASSKFYVDPISGVIRSMVSFSLEGGKLFSFDVKATDREGSDAGNSAVTNVFVYVLPETKMVLFVTNTEPISVEKKSHNIMEYLSNVTGFDVKMAKLEPHREGEYQDAASTDLFLYAINPDTNDIVDTDMLLDVFRQNSQAIVEHLDQFKIRRIQGVMVQEKISQMGATEVAIIALSSVIFLGTVLAIALLCSTCKERKLKKRQTSWEQQRLYNIKNPLMGKATANPYASRVNGHSSSTYSTGDGATSEYVDSLSSFKRNAAAITGSRLGAMNNMRNRQQVPADGASSLNPPRSPRFSDRYRNSAASANNPVAIVPGDASDWFENKEEGEVVEESGSVSGYSGRGSARSARSGFSASSWSSRPKSRTSPATEL